MQHPPRSAFALALTGQLAFLVAAGWATGTLLLDVLGGHDAARVDRFAVGYLAEHRNAWLTTTMGYLTWLGTSFVLVPLVAVLGVASRLRRQSWATMAQLALSLGGAIILYDLIKVLVGRPRPQVGQLVSTATGYAFPSGHATQIAAVSVTIALLGSALTRSWPRKVTAWCAVALTALIVSFSRIYLGVHWPTDVLAGCVLGGLWALLSIRTVRSLGSRPAPFFVALRVSTTADATRNGGE